LRARELVSTVVAGAHKVVAPVFVSRVGNLDTPHRLDPRTCWCACITCMAADNANRSTERSVGVMCRMSAAEREELKYLAQAAGCSVQTYIMRAVFGRTEIQDLPRGRANRQSAVITL